MLTEVFAAKTIPSGALLRRPRRPRARLRAPACQIHTRVRTISRNPGVVRAARSSSIPTRHAAVEPGGTPTVPRPDRSLMRGDSEPLPCGPRLDPRPDGSAPGKCVPRWWPGRGKRSSRQGQVRGICVLAVTEFAWVRTHNGGPSCLRPPVEGLVRERSTRGKPSRRRLRGPPSPLRPSPC